MLKKTTQYDYSKLLGIMAEHGYTKEYVAKNILQIQPGTLTQKLNNKSDFSVSEMEAILDAFNIPIDKISYYFFCKNTCENAS